MIILHHYPQSPVSEKVRVALGIKELAWRSVQVPRLPPKPDVTALTGGYRRTPVMQIGADIYCDSQCILRELERRYPVPTLFPDGREATAWGLSRWIDGPLFTLTLAVVLGSGVDDLSPDFAADRGRLYFGPNYDLHKLKQRLPDLLSQLRAQLVWMERMLGGKPFMHDSNAGLTDALCYYLVWFIRGRYRDGAELVARCPDLAAWESRVAAIGHGRPADLTAHEAIDLAASSEPDGAADVDPADPLALSPGDPITVTPSGEGGDPGVAGELVRLGVDNIAIRRRDERAGELVVHFPRVGYEVQRQ